MQENTRIKRASISHLPSIVDIYNQAIRKKFATADMTEYSVEGKLDWFQKHDDQHPVFVALEGSVVTGWYSLTEYREGRQAFSGVREVSYYVRDTHQQRGIGSMLLGHAIERAAQMQVEHLVAIILDRNEGSIRLLKKYGFQLWGHLPGIANFDGDRCAHQYYGLALGSKDP